VFIVPRDGEHAFRGRTGVFTSSRSLVIGFSEAGDRLEILLDRPQAATTCYFGVSKSERGLDSAEWSPEGEPEARASGKSERSERNDGGRSRSRRVVA
jgi:hypothetical protein